MQRLISFLVIVIVLTACQPATSTVIPPTTVEIPAVPTATPEAPTAEVQPVHPDTITVAGETITVTVAEGNGAGIPTVGVKDGSVYLKDGETWRLVDLIHMEYSWPQDVKDKIPTLLAAEQASDRAKADSAPIAEWHEDSAYKRNEILQILKASGIDVTQFTLEGKSKDEITKINDSMFDAWITWNEQHGIKEASVSESLLAAVVSYAPNYEVAPHYGADKLSYGWGASGSGFTEEGLRAGVEQKANQQIVSIRGENFTLYHGTITGADGKQRIFLHRMGYGDGSFIDVIGLGNGRNTVIAFLPHGATTLASDICLYNDLTANPNATSNCNAGEAIQSTKTSEKYPAAIMSNKSDFVDKLENNSGVQVRWSGTNPTMYWLDGVMSCGIFITTPLK